MEKINLYYMAYSQGKFFANMLFMTDIDWYEKVSNMPKNLRHWLAYEVDDRDLSVPYCVSHEFIGHKPCIQIIPDIQRVKILQQLKDTSGTTWEKFFKRDVENWQTASNPLYSVKQTDLQDWPTVERHLIFCELILDLNIEYILARKYFNVYWQAHRNLF